jgi:hypothetical protein
MRHNPTATSALSKIHPDDQASKYTKMTPPKCYPHVQDSARKYPQEEAQESHPAKQMKAV